mmetsp:Transcript_90/g.331  ORF Transcript_90/g.331 Transcript_90/m.331 type:complete len:593 (-) Transcript_90:1057-2835(-)|eukprot:CAMPEP_0117435320 /NCGR_PEP_ID=MMETSP0759-20121206/419_1 /TAXON_ID=63605 /ORGANISM="Percolomonas cosmopolitus, Strain WS" /LENGTH=592 /DNA_ID=CAMNT_0005226861 /DNA_START=271 /DNA_END=2049 /DNA_ORIENTATION=-
MTSAENTSTTTDTIPNHSSSIRRKDSVVSSGTFTKKLAKKKKQLPKVVFGDGASAQQNNGTPVDNAPGQITPPERRQSSSSPNTKSQKKMILALKFKKENQLLREKLTDMHKVLAMTKSVQLTNKINKLQEVGDENVKKLSIESNKLQEYNNQLELLDAQIMDARVNMGGVDNTQRSNEMIRKQIKILENKLDSTLTKFNELLSQNKALRLEIENLREEKQTFDSIYKKMENELYTKKQQMAECIEQSNNAYTDRDEALQQLNVLVQARDAEMAKYNTQLAELDDIIATDQEVNDQLKKAEKERTAGIIGSMTREQETTLKVKVVRGNWSLAEKAAKQLIIAEKMKNLQDMLAHIEQSTELGVDQLIEKFIEAEDVNFSLFTYVNELNSEIEKLEQQIHAIEHEYEEFDGDAVKKSVIDRHKDIDSLKHQLSNAQKASENYQKSTTSTTEVVKTLGPMVLQLFETVGGDVGEMEKMLGTTNITENNISMYLGVIEHKTNYLRSVHLQNGGASKPLLTPRTAAGKDLVTKHSGRRTGRRKSQPNTSRRRKSTVTGIAIDPPLTLGTEQSDDDDDSNEMPLTREELIQKESTAK